MQQELKIKKEVFEFRVDTAALLNEIADAALKERMGILKIPLNIFRLLLIDVANRANELNDPQLNICMMNLGLYEIPPSEVVKEIKKQQKRIKK